MKKKIVLLICCVTLAMTACGKETAGDAAQVAPETENAQTENAQTQDAQAESAQAENAQTESPQTESAQTEETDSVIAADQTDDPITEDQALEAIKQYCYANNSELEEMAASDEYNIFWDVTTNEKGEIVVLFRSYTGSESRYYINPETGETYGTELVPGIIDEEQRTEESFNVRDYMKEGAAAGTGTDASADPNQISKEIDENAQKAASLMDELVGVNTLYDKYDEARMNAQTQTAMNEASQYGTMVWKSEAESIL